MDLYFDESGGRRQDKLIFGGVAFHSEELRQTAERAWKRPDRKARKWSVADFRSFTQFLRDHCSMVTGCHVQLTQDLRDAISVRMRQARDLGIHTAHGSRSTLKPYSWLWMHMAGHFSAQFMAAVVESGLIVDELRIHPDRSSLPDWQRKILTNSLSVLDGKTFRELVSTLAEGPALPDFIDACLRSARWGAPQFWPSARSSRLTDIADGYCALYSRAVDGDDEISTVIRDELGVSQQITTDLTTLLLWRARLDWEESASSYYPHGLRSWPGPNQA